MHKHDNSAAHGRIGLQVRTLGPRLLLFILSFVFMVTGVIVTSPVVSAEAKTYDEILKCHDLYDGKSAVSPTINNLSIPVPQACANVCTISNANGLVYECQLPKPDDAIGKEAAAAVAGTYVTALLDRFCTTTGPTSGATRAELEECRTNLRQAAGSCITAFQTNGYEGSSAYVFPNIDPSIVAGCISGRLTYLPQNQVRTTMQAVEAQAKAAGDAALAISLQEYASAKACTDAGGTFEDGECIPADGVSTCEVEGVGWAICPVMEFLGTLNDNAFEQLAKLLQVEPSLLTDGGSLLEVWGRFRDLANILFVIAFLWIVYGQMVGGGRN